MLKVNTSSILYTQAYDMPLIFDIWFKGTPEQMTEINSVNIDCRLTFAFGTAEIVHE